MTIKFYQYRFLYLVFAITILPFILNLLGFDFSSQSFDFSKFREYASDVTADDKFNSVKGGLHHALMEWTAVSIALIAGCASFLHYQKHLDVSVPIIGLALLCAGFTDAFHTLAATRVISANVPNADFIPFTWAFSRTLNATLILIGISVSFWLRNKYYQNELEVQREWGKKYGFKVIAVIASIFIGFSISLVLLAATSEALPQTTFKQALITRPFDVLPFGLFAVAIIIAIRWYRVSPSILRYALVLSLIPELVTQLHMAFGSTALFDNHFNIAHALKVLAYSCLLIGILYSLFETDERKPVLSHSSADFDRANYSSRLGSQLLKVGNAKYPLTLVIPGFAFALVLLVSYVTTTIYIDNTERLVSKERLVQANDESLYIEDLLSSFYQRVERDVNFLSKTPPIQKIAEAIERKDQKSFQDWYGRLAIIFEQFLKKEPIFKEIRLVQLSGTNQELVKSFRRHNDVFIMPRAKLKNSLDDYVAQRANDFPGQITFNSNKSKSFGQLSNEYVVGVSISIYSQTTNTIFATIELKFDLRAYIASFRFSERYDKDIFIASERGEIIYRSHKDYKREAVYSRDQKLFQTMFPFLTTAIIQNTKYQSINNQELNSTTENGADKNRITGLYRTLELKNLNSQNKLRIVILLDTEATTLAIKQHRDVSYFIGLGLAMLMLVVSLVFSRRITGPMQEMITEFTRYEYTGKVKELPTKATDEIGVFARTFHNMLVVQREKDLELVRQKYTLDEHAIVSITDVKGAITYVNEKFCAISGYEQNELLGENHRVLNSGYHDKSFFKEMFKELIQGNTWESEICNKSKDGGRYWVQTTIVPFMNERNKPESYISIRTDISQSKTLALELAKTRDIMSTQLEQLQDANEDLDQFAYVASHDLKSPLNGINQLVSWIEEDCEDILPEESKEHLGLLRSRSRRMLNLLNDLLDYSRIGRNQQVKEIFNLKEKTKELFELQGCSEGFTCSGQNVDLELERVPFEMVLRNLISNAIKHHDKEKGRIEVSHDLIDVDGKALHQFKIKDDGPGIPPDLQSKAMEMFQTLQSRDETEGSGMGLAMVKKMAEKHGGSLTIDSDGKRGTTFIVRWAA